MSKSSSGSSFQSFQMAQLKEMIDKLPKEYRDAMNVGIVVEVGNLKNKLSDQIYDSKKEELIESLNTQINFRVSKALQDPKYATIKKDIIFYKNAYEKEAANVNEIITATNKLKSLEKLNIIAKIPLVIIEKAIITLADNLLLK